MVLAQCSTKEGFAQHLVLIEEAEPTTVTGMIGVPAKMKLQERPRSKQLLIPTRGAAKSYRMWLIS
jgi:hypothetical protein